MSIKSLSGGELPGTYLVALSNPETTEIFGGSAMPTPLSPNSFWRRMVCVVNATDGWTL